MAFWKHKQSAVEQRLKLLDAEMSKVNSEIKHVSRAGGLRPPISSRLKREQTRRTAAQDIVAPGNESSAQTKEEVEGKNSAATELPFSTYPETTGKSIPERKENQRPAGSASYSENHEWDPRSGHGRKKFVNYFAAGQFHNLRTLRQNNNALRNKAIMMAVLAALAAFGLLFHLFGR